MEQPIRVFPRGLVGGDGRRLRLGSLVEFRLDGATRQGEVVGWSGRRGVQVHLSADPHLAEVQPVDLVRLDIENVDPQTLGWRVVEDDDAPTLLVVPVGTRDVVTRPGASSELPLIRESTFRADTASFLGHLSSIPTPEQASVTHTHLDMPILRRVLDEASLPDVLHRIVFVTTDQHHVDPRDTVHVEALARLWLEGRGHLDPDADTRPVTSFAEPIVVTRLPHVLDAVVHQVRPQLTRATRGCQRIVTVLAGGTPATMYGTLLAAGSVTDVQSVRSVQVPAALRVDGRDIVQPLVESDLADSSIGEQR